MDENWKPNASENSKKSLPFSVSLGFQFQFSPLYWFFSLSQNRESCKAYEEDDFYVRDTLGKFFCRARADILSKNDEKGSYLVRILISILEKEFNDQDQNNLIYNNRKYYLSKINLAIQDHAAGVNVKYDGK